MKIEFFEEGLLDAARPGIYEIEVVCAGEPERRKEVYIGESVYPLVRCARHLYELKKAPEYLGFSDLEKENVTLRLFLVEYQEDRAKRKTREKELIREREPLSQSGHGDRQKGCEEKIAAMNAFLEG